MTPAPDRAAHDNLLDALMKQDDLQALEAHRRACPVCQGEPGEGAGPREEAILDLARRAVVEPPPAAGPGANGVLPPTEVPGQLDIPNYDILRELGRGGMAVVYEARQKSLGRVVALKMILAGAHASTEALVRFQVEAQAVARLQHPNIVQVYDAGVHQGQPFFTMELVPGVSLARKMADRGGRPLPEREAVEIVLDLALAMDYAHKNNIVHRDLKPANVLLTDKEEIPKVADFGLAIQLDRNIELTNTGAALGTPIYMAPEQAQGKANGQTVGPATDVHALGVILYELLTGGPPYQGSTPLEVMNQVVNATPTPPRKSRPEIGRGLESICLKCLKKAPQDRYRDAWALALDLRAYLDGLEGKGARRPWPLVAAVATGALVSVTLLVLLLLSVVQVRQQAGELDTATGQTIPQLQSDLDEARRHGRATDLELQQALTKGEQTAAQFREAQLNLGAARQQNAATTAQLRQAEQEQQEVSARWVRLVLDHATTASALAAVEVELRQARERSATLAAQLKQAGAAHIAELEKMHKDAQAQAKVAEDKLKAAEGRHLDALVKLKAAEGQHQAITAQLKKLGVADVAELNRQCQDALAKLKTAEGRYLGALVAQKAAEAQQQKALAAQRDAEAQHQKALAALKAVEKQDQVVAALLKKAGVNTVAELVDRYKATQDQLALLKDKAPQPAPVNAVKKGNQFLWKAHTDRVTCMVLSADGKLGLSSSLDKTVCVWDLEDRKLLTTLQGHKQGVLCLALSHDGSRALSGGRDKTVRLWDTRSGKELKCFKGHEGNLLQVAFDPDGKHVHSVAKDGTFRRWDIEQEREVFKLGKLFDTPFANVSEFGLAAISRDGSQLLTTCLDEVKHWDVKKGTVVQTWKAARGIPTFLTFSPDNKYALCGDSDGGLRLWQVDNGKEKSHFQSHKEEIVGAAFLARTRVISADEDGVVIVWDLKDETDIGRFKTDEGTVEAVAFSADGRRVFLSRRSYGDERRILCLWELSAGKAPE
jgi:hypothetical protein